MPKIIQKRSRFPGRFYFFTYFLFSYLNYWDALGQNLNKFCITEGSQEHKDPPNSHMEEVWFDQDSCKSCCPDTPSSQRGNALVKRGNTNPEVTLTEFQRPRRTTRTTELHHTGLNGKEARWKALLRTKHLKAAWMTQTVRNTMF